MKWIYLFIAGALEITWAVAMKMSDGFTHLLPSSITGVGCRIRGMVEEKMTGKPILSEWSRG